MDSTQKLEELFGIIRCMQGGDINFSVLQLQQQIADYSAIQNIYLEHPEWLLAQRRLKVSNDRKNVLSWTGNLDIRIVNEVGYWKISSQNAKLILTQDGVFNESQCNFSYLATLPNADILRPCGRLIGVLAEANAHIDIEEDENND